MSDKGKGSAYEQGYVAGKLDRPDEKPYSTLDIVFAGPRTASKYMEDNREYERGRSDAEKDKRR